MHDASRTAHRSCVLAALALLTMAPGCGPIATIAWLIHGPEMVPAKFDGLKGKKVAVVCLDANSLSGPGGEADAVGKAVAMTLANNVHDITMIPQSKVADWLDSRGDDVTDYRDVGRGVKADMVVGIDLLGFTLHEGKTLLKGKSKVGVKVYDMRKGGELVYELAPQEISWPENGARHVTENEANFRAVYIGILAERIARDFYPFEFADNFSNDARHLAN